MDPDIISFPLASLFRKPLARFISSRRSKKVALNYAAIGGKSPILELTNAQAQAVETRLRKTIHATVFVAMRYWHPLTEVAAKQVQKGGFQKAILLPLYPQNSITTSGSSLHEWSRQCRRIGLKGIQEEIVHHFYDNPNYVSAIVDNVNLALARFKGRPVGDVHLVFSAHGVPVSIIEGGDSYQRHIEETVKLVLERGRWKSPWTLCYQSKVGPAEWLKPSLVETIDKLAKTSTRNVLVIPVAFLTEHIETLHEINIETRHQAEHLGLEQFEVMPALNSHPKLIQALCEEVMRKVEKS